MKIESPNLVVITGGPGAGKTTMLGELERRGFNCVPEIARQIIQEQARSGGNALPWADTDRYCRLMLERSVASFQENHPAYTLTFCDRGIPDTLCAARLLGLTWEREILAACRSYRYATRVFLAPPWREIYETDKERKQTYEEAVRTSVLLAQIYQDCGYEVVEIPRVSPARRVEFLLEQVAV